MNNWIKNTKTNRKNLLHGESVIVREKLRVVEGVYNSLTDEFDHPYYGQTILDKFDKVTHFMPMPSFP